MDGHREEQRLDGDRQADLSVAELRCEARLVVGRGEDGVDVRRERWHVADAGGHPPATRRVWIELRSPAWIGIGEERTPPSLQRVNGGCNRPRAVKLATWLLPGHDVCQVRQRVPVVTSNDGLV